MELPHIWQPASRVEVMAGLRHWFATGLGSEVLNAEHALLDHILPDLFGYHALQLGQVVPCNLLQTSRIRHRLVVDAAVEPVAGLSHLQAQPDQLPFASDSIDVVVLHHLLDVTRNPHGVLREATRVLLPEGHLVILGFNPWSLWGLWRFFRLPWSSTPWLRRVISAHRLADWLALLDFEIVGVESAFFRPPVDTGAIRQRLGWLDALGLRYWSQGGATYAILARKRVACLTPLRLRQPLLRILRPAIMVETRDTDSGQFKQQEP